MWMEPLGGSELSFMGNNQEVDDAWLEDWERPTSCVVEWQEEGGLLTFAQGHGASLRS